jgi:hypothetical protein
MSRTYRLRHEYSDVAHKFGDGRYTVHIDTVDNELSALIIHGIYGYPCELAKPLEYIDEGIHGVRRISHYNVCLELLKLDWFVKNSIIKKLGGNKRYSIASMWYHKYAHPGNSVNKVFKKYYMRCFRLRCNTSTRMVIRSSDFDGDWDTKMFARNFRWR